MKKVKLGTIQYVSIEDIPGEHRVWLMDLLPKNGGNVVSVDAYTDFGDWLVERGFVFDKSWAHLVVFR